MEYEIEVQVSLKKGVLDAEGETVQKSLKLLGFEVKNVETIKNYKIKIDSKTEKEALETVEEACKKLLANPVIQDYSLKGV